MGRYHCLISYFGDMVGLMTCVQAFGLTICMRIALWTDFSCIAGLTALHCSCLCPADLITGYGEMMTPQSERYVGMCTDIKIAGLTTLLMKMTLFYDESNCTRGIA